MCILNAFTVFNSKSIMSSKEEKVLHPVILGEKTVFTLNSSQCMTATDQCIAHKAQQNKDKKKRSSVKWSKSHLSTNFYRLIQMSNLQ